MFSAWFGALVGLLLELRTGRSIFGAGASFVGWLSLGAIFVVPYVFQKSIGENIGQVNGVLMSYWLYIHVTTVTASYALIGMGFALSVWWLIKYYMNYDSVSQMVAGGQLAGEARGLDIAYSAAGGGGFDEFVFDDCSSVVCADISGASGEEAINRQIVAG